jgi:hypothetical protein
MRGEVGDDPGLYVAGRTQVECHVASAEQVQQLRVAGCRDAVGDATDSQVERVADSIRSGDLAGMGGERQPAALRGAKGSRVGRHRIRLLGTGQIETDHRPTEGSRGLGQLDVRSWRVRAHGRHDEPNRWSGGAVSTLPLGHAIGHGGDDIVDREPSADVEARRPTDLAVRDSIGGHLVDELERRSPKPGSGLQQGDRQVEVREQLGLVAAAWRGHQPAARFVEGDGHACFSGQLHGGRRSQGAIEMLVQLGLGKPAQLAGIHQRMIGSRMVLGVLAVLALGVAFGQRPADPAEADPARALAVERRVAVEAQHAENALESLDRLLRAALADGRSGAAAVMAGDESPGPRLSAAAAHLERARAPLMAVHEALERLDGTLRATSHAGGPSLDLTAGRLNAIAAQLEGSATTADAFAQLRAATEAALAGLERALVALRDEDPAGAVAATADARQRIEQVERWEEALPTLPLWLGTARGLIDAVSDLAGAQLGGDATAAAAAGRAYEQAAGEARRADQALAVALADGGSAITMPSLQQLASALELTEETRTAVASLVHRFTAGHERRGEW